MINKLLKKDQFLEWTLEKKKSFLNIKSKIVLAPIPVSPDLDKHFILYSFTSKETIIAILTQKNKKEEEHRASFTSRGMQDYELIYSLLENLAFSLVKVVTHFQTYCYTSYVHTCN